MKEVESLRAELVKSKGDALSLERRLAEEASFSGQILNPEP